MSRKHQSGAQLKWSKDIQRRLNSTQFQSTKCSSVTILRLQSRATTTHPPTTEARCSSSKLATFLPTSLDSQWETFHWFLNITLSRTKMAKRSPSRNIWPKIKARQLLRSPNPCSSESQRLAKDRTVEFRRIRTVRSTPAQLLPIIYRKREPWTARLQTILQTEES